MKRDPQVFEWKCEKGVLAIVGRKDGPMAGESRRYELANYPQEIRQNIADAGFKAIFQQRSSQVSDDYEKLAYWDALDGLFQDGEWAAEGQRGAPLIGAWVEVLADVKGVDVGVIQASLAKYDKDQRARIRKSVEDSHADKIAAKKAARKADTIDLL